MERLKPVDVVIVGGGWTGLLMAKEITSRTPLSVVVLERGPARETADYSAGMDELDYYIRLRMMQNIAEETITHRHSSANQAVPVRQYGSFNPGTGVGGAGEHWGAVANRFLPADFKLATHLKEKFGASRLPENLSIQDWGFTFDEIEPYYWRAEQMMGVGGKAGNLGGKLIEGGNPIEGVRSHEYPNPPHKMSYLGTMFTKAARELGYHSYPIPSATLTQDYTNPDGITRPACQYCGYCSKYGCMIGAKAQPTNTLMPLLSGKKNFALRKGCWVRRVVHRDGRAEGVTYIDPAGQETMQPADVVVLASWTLNNSRLLLLSSIGEPYDPATGKGTLGKNLTHQVNQGVQLFFDKPLNSFMGAGGLGMGIGDFEGDPGPNAPPDVLRGGTIRASSGGDAPISTFGRIPPGEAKSSWGKEWKKAALKWHDKVGSVACEGAHLAYRQNYLDLDPTYTDKFGDPLMRLTLDWTDHERRQAAFLAGIATSIGKGMGAAQMGGTVRGIGARYAVTYYQSTHVQGGVIMGDSPERSVVNTSQQHWRMPNLWVTGGCAFPQNAAGNPTLTILAATYRVADAFVDRYLKKPGALA
jgi:gluconate 2-dehydrogenase alpha chain